MNIEGLDYDEEGATALFNLIIFIFNHGGTP